MRTPKPRSHVAKTHSRPRARPRGAGRPDARDPEKQDRLTPLDLIHAVEHRFGPLVFDLAAERGKSVLCLPYFTEQDDALVQDWERIARKGPLGEAPRLFGNRWLNPPFGMVAKFAAKASRDASPRCPVLMLHLASVDSNWFWEWVAPFALSWAIDRVTFVGETQPFIKPLMLSLFGFGGGNGHIQRWRWKTGLPQEA